MGGANLRWEVKVTRATVVASAAIEVMGPENVRWVQVSPPLRVE